MLKTSEFSQVRSVQFSYILYFLDDLQLINKPCFKPNYNNVKEDKGVFVIDNLDQAILVGTYRKITLLRV